MKKYRAERISDGAITRIYAESHTRDGSFIIADPHSHPYCEMLCLRSGACRFFIEGSIYDLNAGDIMLIPPHTYHYARYIYGKCKKTSLFFREEEVENWVRTLLPQGAIFSVPCRYFMCPRQGACNLKR